MRMEVSFQVELNEDVINPEEAPSSLNAVIVAAGAALFTFYLTGQPVRAILMFSLTLIACFQLERFIWKNRVLRDVQSYYQMQKQFTRVVAIDEVGVTTTQLDETWHSPWSEIKSVAETARVWSFAIMMKEY
jgi:hypothetical protein